MLFIYSKCILTLLDASLYITIQLRKVFCKLNPCLFALQVLKHVGPETIVTHEVSAETAGNLIGQRDFLSVRHSCKQKSSVYLGGAAIQLESFPPQAGFVRYSRIVAAGFLARIIAC